MDINTLYVQTQGNFRNEAVIFLHAFPLSSDMWKEQMQTLSKNHYTLAPDLPGFGKGTLPVHAITFEYYVDAVLNFIKEAGIKQSIWCGLSMGGYLALRLYERAPELCSGLILANTKATADDNATKEKRWSAIKTLHSHRNEFIENQFQAMMGKSAQENFELKKQYLDILSKNTEEGMSAGLVSLATRMDHSLKLSQIHVPTLIIGGEEDHIISIDDLEFLHEQIPTSHLEIIEGAGHLSNMEKPEVFNKVVAEFLANVHSAKLHTDLMN
jgi:3-oxoadipate enol-lactonase